MTTEPQLSVRGITKRFGDSFELSPVDLTVGDDEIVALLGPSGCGKTTILRCIAGVESPDSGQIEIGGQVVESPEISKPPDKRAIGMVYQNYAIWPHKTVFENVVFPLEHADHGIPNAEYDDRVTEMLELMEIPKLADKPATDLSGGQQQRTALARALVAEPDLLLMDEPLSNLDKELRKQMRYELQRLQHELGVSILYVTHDQEEAFYLADRVIILHDGQVVERGEPEALYESPQSAFTRRFIGARNPFDGRIEVDSAGTRILTTDFLEVPLASTTYMANGEGPSEVSCFLRPEDLVIDDAVDAVDAVDDDSGGIELQGTVVAEGILGDRYEVTVRFDDTDTELTVHCESTRRFSRGDRLALRVDPAAIQVYANTI